MRKLVPLVLIISLFSVNALAYGPRGHRLVGAIADKRLARNRTVAKKVRDLLGGLTLAEVSTFPDEIKSWDGCRGNPSMAPVTSKQRINDELRAFLEANPCSGEPNHHEFHFTDVPVTGDEVYADGEVGRFEFDIVQMIPFCVRVLRGEEPETNDRGITKSVAVILLAHYLGDIHQPLHVGAEFFDRDGLPFQPSTSNLGFADQGGNKLVLFTLVNGALVSAGKLHGYWDSKTFENAFGVQSDASVVRSLAARQPAGWKLTGDTETWAEQMANEILPLARQARTRLMYQNIEIVSGARDIRSGEAKEKRPRPGQSFYSRWAADVVKREIHKGGWRLAALLEKTLD